MRKTILTLFILGTCIGASAGVQAAEADDTSAFQQKMEHVMVDILCNTHVIRDMGALGYAYMPKIKGAPDAAARDAIKHEFGLKLHQAWLDQKYDMRPHQKIVKFLDWMNTQPMDGQAALARSWTFAAHRQCPAATDDYRETYAAALTLVSTIPY